MELIDDIFGSAQKAGKLVADTAVKTKDYVVLEYKLAGVRNEIASKLQGLGKLAYKAEMGMDVDAEQRQKYVDEIKELTEKLAELNGQMAKHRKVCRECGKSFAGDAEFCIKCGTRL